MQRKSITSIDPKQTDCQILLQERWVYSAISKELHFRVCNHSEPQHKSCVPPPHPRDIVVLLTTLVRRKGSWRASLVAQWLRVHLPVQGTRVRALVWEDPTCRGAAGPVGHNYWACASGACAPQQERPRQWEARAPRWRVAPACHN